MVRDPHGRQEFGDDLILLIQGRADLPQGRLNRSPNAVDIFPGVPGVQFTYMFRPSQTEVAMYLHPDSEESRATFARLSARQDVIEAAFGGSLDWLPRNKRQNCRIRSIDQGGGYEYRERWPAIQEAMLGAMARLYRALGLLVLVPGVDLRPTADREELERQVAALRSVPDLPPPAGQLKPARVPGQRFAYARDSRVIDWVLRLARGQCDLCGEPAPFVRTDGEPYLEVHHVQPLAEGGPDTVENAAALCPNCHRRLHSGGDAVEQRERLCTRVSRLRRWGEQTND